jgi:lipoate-protein ligase B
VTAPVLEVVEAGRVPYATALAWQRRLADDRITRRLPHDLLLLLEHPPVITLGRTAHDAHVRRADGIDVVEVERGGDVTYHGPGQLVGYPILASPACARPARCLRTLEDALITGLAELGIPAERSAGRTGVWTRGRKIASIGIHVKQWVTFHGFALNVTTDLAAFDRIVPCGIAGVEMTSVEREIGEGGRGKGEGLWSTSLQAVVQGFEAAFGFRAVPRQLPAPTATTPA